MRVSVNLATRPFADLGPALRRLRIAMGGLAIIAIALGVGLHFMHNQADAARAREHSLDGSILKMNEERQQYESMMRQPDNAQVLAQVVTLNKLIDAKAFSWTLAMEDLETVLPGGVQVTTLEPTIDKKDGHITVRLRVVGARDKAVELVQNLEHSRHFLQPRIVGENAESTGNGNQQVEPVSATNRVNFDLLADYNPATAAEHKTAHRKGDAQHDNPGQRGQGATTAGPMSTAIPRAGSAGRQRTPNAGPTRPAPNSRNGGPQ
jgi:type IV pilus assembly protein PilN